MGRRRCPLCRSKQWHKEPASGLVVCSEGHVLQNYRNETTETNELGPHAMRKRTLKSGRKKKEKTSKADPKLYHGARARYHYFQCLQLLLRKQIVALTRLWNLPPEFEIVCRDTWTLHLSLLPTPPPAEPYLHERDAAGHSGPADKRDSQKSALSDNGDENDKENDLSSSSSSSDSEDEQEEDDPEMAELLRENSELGSDSDDHAAEPSQPVPLDGHSKRRKGRTHSFEAPASNVAVLMFACWTMRIPVVYMDFIRLIELYDLPYLDPLRQLPPPMASHLTKHTVQALSPHHAPTTLFLHALTSRLSKLARSSYGIFTPELNAAPVLWRAIRSLGGTSVLYSLTKKLAHVLSLPLTLHHSLAPGLEKIRKNDPESHQFDNAPPEVALAASIIIVLKMVYGLDGKPRQPTDRNDPACALPRLDEYLALLRRLDEEDAQTKEALFSAKTPMSVGDLSGPVLDDYLDFCERALTGHPKDEDLTVLSSYFPLGARAWDNEAATSRVEDPTRVSYDLPANMPGDQPGVFLPGQSYSIYKAADIFGALPEEYELVASRAARWAGVSNSYLYRVIERFEHRVARWWGDEKRKSREENK